MKRFTKIMLSAGGALLIGTGAVTSYLKAQQPEQQMSDLTLANIEAMAIDLDDFDGGWTSTTWRCKNKEQIECGATCGACKTQVSGKAPLVGRHSCDY